MTYVFSASQINSYMSEPWLWVIQSLFKIRGPQNQWAIKGDVFGAALEKIVLSQDFDNVHSHEVIQNEVEAQCKFAGLEVPSMSTLEADWKIAIDHYRQHKLKGYDAPLPPPAGSKKGQHYFEMDCKHGKVCGYIDLLYPKAGRDVKYRTEIEQKPRVSDMIQLACYWKKYGGRWMLDEFSKGKKRSKPYGQEELEPYWKIAEHNMGCMNDIIHMKEVFDDDPDCMKIILRDLPIHNPDGYWFPQALELRKEILG